MITKRLNQSEWIAAIKGMIIMFVLALAAIIILAMLSSKLGLPLNSLGNILLGLGSFITISIVFWTKNKERQIQIEQEHRKQKTEVYEKFMDFYFKMFKEMKQNGMPPIEEIMDKTYDFKKGTIIWGSENLILQANQSFKQMTTQGIDANFAFEDLMFAMRADLGHKDKILQRGDLLRGFVTDIDNYC